MAHNCHGNPKELTAKPKGFWFCRELFGFVVTVVGQNTNRGKNSLRPAYLLVRKLCFMKPYEREGSEKRFSKTILREAK